MNQDPTIGFNPNEVTPNTGGSGKSLPVSDENGWPVIITNAEWKDNSTEGSGKHLACDLRITEGPHQGREGVFRLNLLHATSAGAISMAKGDLSAMCAVTGQLQNLSQPCIRELWNIPFRIVVKLQDSEEAIKKGWTEIKKFLYIDGRSIGQPAGQGGGGQPGTGGGGQPGGFPGQAQAQVVNQQQQFPPQQQFQQQAAPGFPPQQQQQQLPTQQVQQQQQVPHQQQAVNVPQQNVAAQSLPSQATMAGIAQATQQAQGGAIDPNNSAAPKWTNLPTS